MASPFEIVDAKRSRRPLKMEFQGVTGGGKTYSALRLAFLLKRLGIGQRIVLCDSENNSGHLYQGIVEDGESWEYKVCPIPEAKRNPLGYLECYNHVVGQGYDIVIVDSTTHMWKGALAKVDQLGAANKGDKFGSGWKHVSPELERLLNTMLDDRAHLIATSRVKTEWEITTNPDTGKKKYQKLGTKADQRDGIEYEFDCVCRFDDENGCVVEKVRGCTAMHKAYTVKPGPDFWEPLLNWWQSGAELPPLAQRWEAKLRQATTLPELQTAWGSIYTGKEQVTAEEFAFLEVLKNERKVVLSPK
jgi:hypothetical protein